YTGLGAGERSCLLRRSIVGDQASRRVVRGSSTPTRSARHLIRLLLCGPFALVSGTRPAPPSRALSFSHRQLASPRKRVGGAPADAVRPLRRRPTRRKREGDASAPAPTRPAAAARAEERSPDCVFARSVLRSRLAASATSPSIRATRKSGTS